MTTQQARFSVGAAPSPARVVYLMTHYPRVALTFIASEIDAMERAGVIVSPIAINTPSVADIPDNDAEQRRAGTLYLKASLGKVLVRAGLTCIRHPVRFAKLLALAVSSSGADLTILGSRLAHLCYATVVAHHCRVRRIRHVHAHFGLTPATVAWFAGELLKDDSKSRITWSFTIHGFQDFIEQKLSRLDLKGRFASFVVCISDFTRSQLCRISDPADWPRFHVVRCGVNLEKFAFAGVPAAGPELRVITVGRLSPEKGHIVLLHAIRTASDQGLRVRLCIVGSGPFEAAIRTEAGLLNLEDRVEFCGEKMPQEVIALLKQSDIFCLPSFSEGLPVSIMEAMAIGIPVVTTGISGIPELARDQDTAWTVPPANPEALARALLKMASQRESWSMVTQNARTEIEHNYDQEKNAAVLLNLFSALIDRPSG